MRPERGPTFHRFGELTEELASRDFQVHTNWTDGKGSVREVLKKAREQRVAEIAFTEHARHTSTYYPAFFAEVDREAKDFPEITTYRGFEVKILDFEGALDISDDMRKNAEIILASVHSLPSEDHGVVHAKNVPRETAVQTELRLSLGLVRSGGADVLSHPGGMSCRFHGGFPMESYDEILAAICVTNIAFEINYSYHENDFKKILPMLRAYNPFVSIGSDVHDLDTMGRCRDMLREALWR